MSELSDRLNELNREGLSLRAIERKAADAGHVLSYSTASIYLSGKHGTPTQAVLAAFASVFRVPVDQLRDVAGLPAYRGKPLDLGPESARLTPAQREAIRHVVRVMIEESEQHGTPIGADDELAARRGQKEPDFNAVAAYELEDKSEGERLREHLDTYGEDPDNTP